MAECIYSNSINQSILTSGFTIPVDKWETFEKCLGVTLQKGERKDIQIILGDDRYNATYTNVNLKGENAGRTVYQIRYTESGPLVLALRNIFSPNSGDYKAVDGKLEVYSRETGVLEFKCLPEAKVDIVNINAAISLPTGQNGLNAAINRIFNEYVPSKQEIFEGHKMGTFFRKDIPLIIYETGIVDTADYLITGSVGQGNWAMIPWICIFDRSITTTATKGIYIVYLLSKDGNSIYISFNQGCTEIRRAHSKKDTINIMHQNADKIRSRIDNRGFAADNRVSLGNSLTELGELYQEGMIFYKEYKKESVPLEAELQEDLRRMMEIYKDYVNSTDNRDEWWPKEEEYTPGLSKEDWIAILKDERYVTDNLRKVLACYFSIGGQASVLQLIQKYGNTDNFYKMTCMNFAKKLIDDKKCPEPKSGENSRRWPVLFLGRNTKQGEIGDYVWKLRPELKVALEEINILQYLQERGEEKLSLKETVESIKACVAARGFTFEEGLVENYYLSLKSKPFVILAGTSGTGKTRLVRLFAEAIGATSQNGRYKLVSVRPDWSDSSDLFGHVDINGKFIPGAIIDFVKQAELDSNNPYFLCLDEMNLARVEYYLSDILSVIETREYTDGRITTDPLVSENYYGADRTAAGKYGIVRIPENLYITGTVNMDETTFPFSRKVLDRANTIEFSTVDLLANFEVFDISANQILVSNEFLKADYLFFLQCAQEQEYVEEICIELQEINKILEKANAHVGYRVRDEIVFYMLNNKKADLLDKNEAMDNEIMQKILPRIQGSSASVKNMLCELFKHCAGDYDGYQTENDDISSKLFKAAQKPDCKYKHSAEKIAFMVRRFEEDGFTAYWL